MDSPTVIQALGPDPTQPREVERVCVQGLTPFQYFWRRPRRILSLNHSGPRKPMTHTTKLRCNLGPRNEHSANHLRQMRCSCVPSEPNTKSPHPTACEVATERSRERRPPRSSQSQPLLRTKVRAQIFSLSNSDPSPRQASSRQHIRQDVRSSSRSRLQPAVCGMSLPHLHQSER